MMATRLPAKVQRARQTLVRRLAAEPGFVGAGIARDASGAYEIVVMVMGEASPVVTKVPEQWQGIRVRTRVGGVPRKF